MHTLFAGMHNQNIRLQQNQTQLLETEENKRNQSGLLTNRGLTQPNISHRTLKRANSTIGTSKNGLVWDDIPDVNVQTLTEARVKKFTKMRKMDELVKTQLRKPK